MEELQDAQDYPASITATFSLRCSPGLQSDTDNATGWLDPDDPLVSAGVCGGSVQGKGQQLRMGTKALCVLFAVLAQYYVGPKPHKGPTCLAWFLVATFLTAA